MTTKTAFAAIGLAAAMILGGCAAQTDGDTTDTSSDEIVAATLSFDDSGTIGGSPFLVGGSSLQLPKGTVKIKNAGTNKHYAAFVGSPQWIGNRLNILNGASLSPGATISLTITGNTHASFFVYAGASKLNGVPDAEYFVSTRDQDKDPKHHGGGSSSGGSQCGLVCIGGTIDGAERICHQFPPCNNPGGG